MSKELKVVSGPGGSPDPAGPPQVRALAGMVSYDKGSVVSKALIKKETGTVTLFAFDEGEGLSEHTAPFDAPLVILDGEADITISGTVHHLKAGEFITLPAREPHAVKAITPFKMLLIMIRS